MKTTLTHWTKLTIRNAATREILTGEDRTDALREFRARETMLLGTFDRTGGAWETDEPHTWGPQFADDVDWSGFDGDPSYRLVVGKRAQPVREGGFLICTECAGYMG